MSRPIVHHRAIGDAAAAAATIPRAARTCMVAAGTRPRRRASASGGRRPPCRPGSAALVEQGPRGPRTPVQAIGGVAVKGQVADCVGGVHPPRQFQTIGGPRAWCGVPDPAGSQVRAAVLLSHFSGAPVAVVDHARPERPGLDEFHPGVFGYRWQERRAATHDDRISEHVQLVDESKLDGRSEPGIALDSVERAAEHDLRDGAPQLGERGIEPSSRMAGSVSHGSMVSYSRRPQSMPPSPRVCATWKRNRSSHGIDHSNAPRRSAMKPSTAMGLM